MDKVEISCTCSRRYRVRPQQNKHIVFTCAECGRKIRLDSVGTIVSIQEPEEKYDEPEKAELAEEGWSEEEPHPEEYSGIDNDKADDFDTAEKEAGPDEEDDEEDFETDPAAETGPMRRQSRRNGRKRASSRSSKGILIKLAGILLFACAAGACVLIFYKKDKPVEKETQDTSLIAVSTVSVEIREFTFRHSVNVVFRPVKKESVSVPSEMKVMHIAAAKGGYVTIGQKLMTLDFKDDIAGSLRTLETEELGFSGQIAACKVDGSEAALKKMKVLQEKLDRIQEKKKNISRMLQYRVVRSGINGRIHDIRVCAGDTADPGNVLMVISREEELYFPADRKYLPPELVSVRIRIGNQMYTGNTGDLPGDETSDSSKAVFFENTGRSQKSGVPVDIVLICVCKYPGARRVKDFTGERMFVVRDDTVIDEVRVIAGAEKSEWLPLETFKIKQGDCAVIDPPSELKKGVRVICDPYRF